MKMRIENGNVRYENELPSNLNEVPFHIRKDLVESL